MDTTVTSLSYNDTFVIETAKLGTGVISAGNINFVSYQFPKKFKNITSGRVLLPEFKTTGPLSALSVRNLDRQTISTTSLTGSQYNTYILSGGLILSAANLYSSEITSLSTTINKQISSLSASVFNVFTDSGSALLDQYKHQYGIGIFQRDLSGTKTVPNGLNIYSYDIQYKVFYNQNIPGTIVQIASASPFVWVKDFDYNFTNYVASGEDDFGDGNYKQLNKVYIPFCIANVANNDAELPPQTLLTWSVTKFYYISSNGSIIDWNDYIKLLPKA